jgi:hypothetical protein
MMYFNGKDKTTQTAQMLDTEKCWCKDCGWPIIDMCCNLDKSPYDNWDWWMYCSNPTCKNHQGEGISQNECTFIEYQTK